MIDILIINEKKVRKLNVEKKPHKNVFSHEKKKNDEKTNTVLTHNGNE